MKELSVEEKAQRYDEAIEIARYWEKNPTVWSSDDICQKLFPELKESEDEKIRKDIITLVKDWWDRVNKDNISTKEQMLTWLEKQVPAYLSHDDEIMIRQLTEYFTTGKGLQNTNNTVVEWLTDVKRKLEKQAEQKEYTFKSIPRLLDMIEPTDRAKAYCQKLIDTLAKEEYNIDVKIVEDVLKGWNGEDVPMAVMDEQKLADNVDNLHQYLYGDEQKPVEEIKGNNGGISPNPEWSEEDEDMIYKATAVLNKLCASKEDFVWANSTLVKVFNWLKSLKDRCSKQWKPSEEQMLAINTAINVLGKGTLSGKQLIELQEQFKKLREE